MDPHKTETRKQTTARWMCTLSYSDIVMTHSASSLHSFYGYTHNRDSKATEGALAISKCPGDAKLTGVFASGDFASSGIFDGFFQDKSVND